MTNTSHSLTHSHLECFKALKEIFLACTQISDAHTLGANNVIKSSGGFGDCKILKQSGGRLHFDRNIN